MAEAAYKIIQLEEMKDPDGLTCNCGVIQGGTVANTVAQECMFLADIRFATREQLALAREKVAQIAGTSKIMGCTCNVEEINHRPAMVPSEKNMQLLEQMNEIYAAWNLPTLTSRICLSGSDAAYITEHGIPCVDSIGTEGANIHSVKEYMELGSLAAAAKRIASVAVDI